MNDEKNSNNLECLSDGTVIRFRTKKLKIVVRRQRSGTAPDFKYTKPFYYMKKLMGKPYRFPVGNNKATAERIAEEICSFLSVPSHTIEMARAKYNPRLAERLLKFATFRDCIDLFEKNLGTIGRKGQSVSYESFKKYKNFMIAFIRKVQAHRGGKPFVSMKGQQNIDYSEWLDVSTDFLTASAVMDFKTESLPDDDDAEEDDIVSAKISADSNLRQARSLFGAQAMRVYKMKGLILPDITEFMKEPDFGAQKYFQLLPFDVVTRIMRESLDLRAKDLEAYRVFLLGIMCGLRASEAKAFNLTWLRLEDKPVIHISANGTFKPKHGHGRKVFIEEWVDHTIRDLAKGHATGQAFVKDGDAFDRLNTWLHARIPKEFTVKKPTHELRKLWFSYKVKADGLLAAANEGGHKDVKVTQKHYASNEMPKWMHPFWTMPTEEAVKEAKISAG